MSRDQVVAKCRDLMTPVIGAASSAKLIQTLLEIDNLKSIRALRPLIQRV